MLDAVIPIVANLNLVRQFLSEILDVYNIGGGGGMATLSREEDEGT
jgi:hypothetical protein